MKKKLKFYIILNLKIFIKIMIDNEILLFISIYTNNFHLLHILSKYFLQFSKTYNELNYVNRNLWNNYFVSMIFSIIISYQSILHTYFML